MSDLYIGRLSFDTENAFGVKIGRSCNPRKRSEKLTASLPFELQLVATFPGLGHLEPVVHERLGRYRYATKGSREWFRLRPQDAILEVVEVLSTLQEHSEPDRTFLTPSGHDSC